MKPEFAEEKMNFGEFLKRTHPETLPEGWMWWEYEDGGGAIRSPDGKYYYEYDLAGGYGTPYTMEYQIDAEHRFDYFEGSLATFKAFAEECVLEMLQKNGSLLNTDTAAK